MKGKYQEHKDIVAKMFDDVHASLVCNGDRSSINEVCFSLISSFFFFSHRVYSKDLIVDRSGPLSGSHEL